MSNKNSDNKYIEKSNDLDDSTIIVDEDFDDMTDLLNSGDNVGIPLDKFDDIEISNMSINNNRLLRSPNVNSILENNINLSDDSDFDDLDIYLKSSEDDEDNMLTRDDFNHDLDEYVFESGSDSDNNINIIDGGSGDYREVSYDDIRNDDPINNIVNEKMFNDEISEIKSDLKKIKEEVTLNNNISQQHTNDIIDKIQHIADLYQILNKKFDNLDKKYNRIIDLLIKNKE